ncbi:large ATP-binding protein [Streptomyces sp. NPDC052042]|uniref:large ATP-binding protein n=1 Tax=Streptomyces sp. NPDC052042 TaxID=3365683 RepID=UPI0037D71300
MNRYDPAERPGAHLVAEEFAVDDPWDLTDNLPIHHPLDFVGRMVAAAARDVDSLHRQLCGAAQSAIQALESVSRVDHSTLRSPDGILGASASQIELLAARRSAAYDQLTQVISSYRHLLREPQVALSSQAPNLGRKPERDQGSYTGQESRQDDWAIANGRQLTALEAVEAGGLRLRQSAVYGYTYLSNGTGQRPVPEVWPNTISRLVADGLLNQDSSEGLYRPGQLLSLTPKGEEALRDGRTTTSRVTAALQRSQAAPLPGHTDAEVPPPALPGPTSKPSHGR